MPESRDLEGLARLGYDAYDARARAGGYFECPQFDNQDEVLRAAWLAAAEAIAAAGKVCTVCLWHLDRADFGLRVETVPDADRNVWSWYVQSPDRMRQLLDDPNLKVRRIEQMDTMAVGYYAETWWLNQPMCASHASAYRMSGAPLPWTVIW